MRYFNKSLVLFLLCSLLINPLFAQVAEPTQPAQQDHMAWWHEAKFGMFVHWGIYSVVGGEYNGQKLPNSAEWMMCRGKIPIAEYKKYADQFNPTKFDAKEFVGLAKEAGMKYLVITAKHHDGFAMFDSECSDYNVVDATPFKRDIMKELAFACEEAGIRFGFYYSQAQDWHHPGGFGNNWDKSIKRVSSDDYVFNKAVPEAEQLLTDYGRIGIFWWDTPRKMSKEAVESLHSLRKLQPGLITNDRLGEGYKGDHKTFERHIPAQGPTNENWEVCMPISGSWGYKLGDNNFKSTSTLIRNLADIASKGGNYLLNVSPTGEGTLLPQATERLKAIGKWMKINGESIYGTTASPFEKLDWGRCTKRVFADGSLLYLHVFDWPESGEILLPGLKSEVMHAYLLDSNWDGLETGTTDEGVIIKLPEVAPDDINSVVAVRVSGPLEVEAALPGQAKEGVVTLTADMAYLHNNEGAQAIKLRETDEDNFLSYWTDENAWTEWNFTIDEPGTYVLSGEIAVEAEKSKFSVGLPLKGQPVEVESTGGYGSYEVKTLCELAIDEPGAHALQMKPDAGSWNPINVRSMKLVLKEKE